MPGSFPGGGEGGGEGVRTERTIVNTLFEVDQSLPTTSAQIRLADETRYIFVLFSFIRLHFVFCVFLFY
jgi:UBX domain-containing protein 1